MKPASPLKRRVQAKQEYPAVLPPMVDVKDIVGAAAAKEGRCGIYFLCRERKTTTEVVYVGQSLNVHARVGAHMDEDVKTFDRWCYIECHPQQLDLMESLYIHWLRPQQNGRQSTLRTRINDAHDEMCAPIPRRALQHLLDGLAPTVPWRRTA